MKIQYKNIIIKKIYPIKIFICNVTRNNEKHFILPIRTTYCKEMLYSRRSRGRRRKETEKKGRRKMRLNLRARVYYDKERVRDKIKW